jgi:periplasmic divalent cation tolerance protein
MDRVVFVYTTFPTLVEAEQVGRSIVEEGLAACVNIVPGMISHYRWRGTVERAEEVVMFVKTRATLAERAVAAIKQRHSYETPALVVLPVESVDRDYLAWLLAETSVQAGADGA